MAQAIRTKYSIFQIMSEMEKKRFQDMADRDKKRFEHEMQDYTPPKGSKDGKRRRKGKKDPNAPKRSLSAFFWFCNDERARVKGQNPEYGIGDVVSVCTFLRTYFVTYLYSKLNKWIYSSF